MRSKTANPNPAQLGAFWFGIQMVWGALLGISLQARASELAGQRALTAYAELAIAGASVAALTQIAAGILSDRRRQRGSRRIEFYAIGASLGACAVIWFYLAPSYAQLIAAVIVLQIALNIAIGPYQAAIPDFVAPAKLGAASSWMAALQSLGNVAGVLVAALVKNAGAAGTAIAATLMASCMLTAAHVRNLPPNPMTKNTLRVSRTFADLFISRALVYAGFYTLLGYLYFYVARTLPGDAKIQTGILSLTFLVAGAGGAVAAARPVDRMERRNVATIGGIVFITGLVGFLYANAPLPIGAAALLAGGAWGVFLTADWALGCAFLPRGSLATAMGIWNLALLIPQIAAPLIATAVLSALHALQSSHAPRVAFLVAVIEVAGGLGWLRRLPASRAPVHECLPSGNNG